MLKPSRAMMKSPRARQDFFITPSKLLPPAEIADRRVEAGDFGHRCLLALRSGALRRLPAGELVVRLRHRGVHDFAMHTGAGRQLDDIAVGVAEIDRADKAVVDRAADLAAFRLRL